MSLTARLAQISARQPRPNAKPQAMPAPIRGLVTSQNVGAMEPGTAIVMRNWRPTLTGIKVRGGNTLHATVGGTVESLMAYVGNTRQLFSAANGAIYPITTVVDPDVPPVPVVTGQASNYYSSINFPVTGGYRLYAVNGTDDPQLFDGTSWQAVNAASAPISITGVDTDSFIHVNVYRNRLYFVEAGSLNVWYLPVDSLGGAAAALSLAGIFTKGGTISFTATWSSESGANAMEAYLVVMSTEGEVAVFTGDFPGGGNWALVNVYDISRPMGRNGYMRAGGDIIILTEMGMVPVSAARMKDPAALGLDAISRNIEPDWKRASTERNTIPWEIAKVDGLDAFYVNVPVTNLLQDKLTFVGNLKTGALSIYEGWDNRCFAVHNGLLYFGCNDGTIRLAESGGRDLDMPYNGQVAFAWDHLGSPGYTKSVKQAQAIWNTTRPFSYRLSASVDYNQVFPIAPNAVPDGGPDSLWDVGLWDEAMWDSGTVMYNVRSRQISIGRTGQVFSMEIQVPVDGVNTPNVELVMLYSTSTQGAYGV